MCDKGYISNVTARGPKDVLAHTCMCQWYTWTPANVDKHQLTQLESLVPPEASAAICFEQCWPISIQCFCAVPTQPACTSTCMSASCFILDMAHS